MSMRSDFFLTTDNMWLMIFAWEQTFLTDLLCSTLPCRCTDKPAGFCLDILMNLPDVYETDMNLSIEPRVMCPGLFLPSRQSVVQTAVSSCLFADTQHVFVSIDGHPLNFRSKFLLHFYFLFQPLLMSTSG